MKVSEVSVLGGRAQKFLAKILEIAQLLQFAEFKLDASTFLHLTDKDNHTGSAARAEGAGIQKDNQTPSVSTLSLALYGREIAIDDVRKMDVNVGMAPAGLKMQADRRLGGLCVKLGEEIQYDILNGTAADNKMLGFANLVKDALAAGQTARMGFTAAELEAMNERISMLLVDEADQDVFVEKLMKQMRSVPGANAIICNASMSARLTTIGKRKGAAGETVNSFGIAVPTFDRRPIVTVSDTDITCTETDGVNNDCTSLYIVRFAEELGTAISTNSGFYFQDFPDAQDAPEAKARMQFFLQLAVERKDALKRLSRIRL